MGRILNVVFPIFLMVSTANAQPRVIEPSSPAMQAVDGWLNSFLQGLPQFDFLAGNAVYVGGGASRAVLDHIFEGAPLVMRDFDVFAVANRPITENDARTVGKQLESSELGVFSNRDLRPRPRSNPSLPIPQRYSYNAGFGFFWLKNQDIFDLSIFHSAADLALNGMFDIDRIRIKIGVGETLASVTTKIRTIGYQAAVKEGYIEDPHGGYEAWRRKQATIINWDDVASQPVLGTIRAIRTYAKIDYIPDDSTRKKFKELNQSDTNLNRLQVTRNLLKLLEDGKAAWELKLLGETDALATFNPELHQLIINNTAESLRTMIRGTDASTKAEARYIQLGRQLTNPSRTNLLADLKLVAPEVADLEMSKLASVTSCLVLQYRAGGQ